MKYVYWISTVLISAMMLMSAGMYFFNYAHVSEEFTKLGFPLWIIYPLAVAKILAVIMILTRKIKWLTEWAYAGLFFNFILALGAHASLMDDDIPGPVVALVLLLTSYFSGKQVRNKI